eukprot:1158336-Amphidinium_carterae.1
MHASLSGALPPSTAARTCHLRLHGGMPGCRAKPSPMTLRPSHRHCHMIVRPDWMHVMDEGVTKEMLGRTATWYLGLFFGTPQTAGMGPFRNRVANSYKNREGKKTELVNPGITPQSPK